MNLPDTQPESPWRTSDMWAYLESLNWKKNMLPLARVMTHYELLERQLAAERAIADRLGNAIKRLEAWIGDSSPLGQALAAWKEARRA